MKQAIYITFIKIFQVLAWLSFGQSAWGINSHAPEKVLSIRQFVQLDHEKQVAISTTKLRQSTTQQQRLQSAQSMTQIPQSADYSIHSAFPGFYHPKASSVTKTLEAFQSHIDLHRQKLSTQLQAKMQYHHSNQAFFFYQQDLPSIAQDNPKILYWNALKKMDAPLLFSDPMILQKQPSILYVQYFNQAALPLSPHTLRWRLLDLNFQPIQQHYQVISSQDLATLSHYSSQSQKLQCLINTESNPNCQKNHFSIQKWMIETGTKNAILDYSHPPMAYQDLADAHQDLSVSFDTRKVTLNPCQGIFNYTNTGHYGSTLTHHISRYWIPRTGPAQKIKQYQQTRTVEKQPFTATISIAPNQLSQLSQQVIDFLSPEKSLLPYSTFLNLTHLADLKTHQVSDRSYFAPSSDSSNCNPGIALRTSCPAQYSRQIDLWSYQNCAEKKNPPGEYWNRLTIDLTRPQTQWFNVRLKSEWFAPSQKIALTQSNAQQVSLQVNDFSLGRWLTKTELPYQLQCPQHYTPHIGELNIEQTVFHADHPYTEYFKSSHLCIRPSQHCPFKRELKGHTLEKSNICATQPNSFIFQLFTP